FIDTAEGNPRNTALGKFTEELKVILTGYRVQICEVIDMLVCQSRFFSHAAGGQQIGVTVVRIVLDADEAFGYEVLEVGIDKPKCNTQAACQLALRNRLFVSHLG